MMLVVNPTSINIIWNNDKNATEYSIVWIDVVSDITYNDTVNGTESFYTIENLQPCTDYLVILEANQDGEQLQTEESTRTTSQAPFQVTGLNIMQNGCNPMSVTWSPVPAVGNCNISYNIFWNTNVENETQEDTTTDTTYLIEITSFDPSINYYNISVESCAEGNCAQPSYEQQYIADINLAAPVNLEMKNHNTNSITVTWEAPNITNECELTHYQICWEDEMVPETLSPLITEYIITNLTLGKSYNVSLVAEYEAGFSDTVTLPARTTNPNNSANVGAIVGGVVGGLVLVALVVAAVVKRKKIKKLIRGNKDDKTFDMVIIV
ncbi:hypothetical protein Pmani_013375 [Petrolisthes manimaculis]|uniref:Fibronectin type-III domain-containing protein n=1 Tax=Petrolisthes manimaculis TaxID=1843537 RepID=A0AAE1PXI4_9EUCA|nr:hypothetical protein Pmani_013375 [Petrolisthes manimaculis]